MRSVALSNAGCGEYNQNQYHFLEACFLCQKPLGHNSDIFMYRGNTPFCSQECRQEQMEFDEAKERSWKTSSKKALRQATESTQKTSSSPSNKAVRTGTVAVA